VDQYATDEDDSEEDGERLLEDLPADLADWARAYTRTHFGLMWEVFEGRVGWLQWTSVTRTAQVEPRGGRV